MFETVIWDILIIPTYIKMFPESIMIIGYHLYNVPHKDSVRIINFGHMSNN